MGQVTVTINGKDYSIACEDGQESQLYQLGEYVDGRVKELAESFGQIGDIRLMVVACLLLSAELREAQGGGHSIEKDMAKDLIHVAARIEQLAMSLETTA